MKLPILKLRKDQERRILAGHLWIYSNEIDTKETPLKEFSPGQQVAVHSHRNKWIAHAYVNPHSLISARVISRHPTEILEVALLTKRIGNALALRERLFDNGCYRLVYAESDWLPGLVVDRFGDYLSVQITTAGMEAVKGQVIAVLEQLLSPSGILLRNDIPVRELEGLEHLSPGEPAVIVANHTSARNRVSKRTGLSFCTSPVATTNTVTCRPY